MSDPKEININQIREIKDQLLRELNSDSKDSDNESRGVLHFYNRICKYINRGYKHKEQVKEVFDIYKISEKDKKTN